MPLPAISRRHLRRPWDRHAPVLVSSSAVRTDGYEATLLRAALPRIRRTRPPSPVTAGPWRRLPQAWQYPQLTLARAARATNKARNLRATCRNTARFGTMKTTNRGAREGWHDRPRGHVLWR